MNLKQQIEIQRLYDQAVKDAKANQAQAKRQKASRSTLGPVSGAPGPKAQKKA